MYDQFERDLVTSEEFFRYLKNYYKLNHSLREIEDAWTATISANIPGVEPLLKSYIGQVEFYALSNSNRPHIEAELNRRELFGSFKKIFTSYELGCRKPEPEIYLKALEQMKCSPHEVLFVDDKIENIEGARSLGINSEVCKNSAETLAAIFKKYL